MSLRYAESIEILLTPTLVELTLWRRDWCKWRGQCVVERKRIEVPMQDGALAWEAPIIALQEGIASLSAAARTAKVVLADFFCRYTVMPWPSGRIGPSELLQVAAAELESALGIDSSAHEIVADIERYGHNIVVCAVPRELLSFLRASLKSARVRATSISPRFADTCKRWRRRFANDAMVISVQTEMCIVGQLQEGHWRRVRSVRIDGLDMTEVLVLIRRERILQDKAGSPLYLDLEGGRDPSALLELGEVQWLGNGDVPIGSLTLPKEALHAD